SAALPRGLKLGATTGTITGVPASAGTFRITVRVRDARGAVSTETLVLRVGALCEGRRRFHGASSIVVADVPVSDVTVSIVHASRPDLTVACRESLRGDLGRRSSLEVVV